MPSPILPSLGWLLQGLLCMVLFIVGQQYFYLPDCWGDKFETWSFPYRVVFYFIAMSVKRLFFYGPFSITTGCVIASGLGYNGKSKDGADQWDNASRLCALKTSSVLSKTTTL